MLKIVCGKSGSGKTRYLKEFAKNNGVYLRADSFYKFLLQYVKHPSEAALPPVEQLLTLDVKNYAFDDLDYILAGRTTTQEFVFKIIKELTEAECNVAIGVVDEKCIPGIMKKVDKNIHVAEQADKLLVI